MLDRKFFKAHDVVPKAGFMGYECIHRDSTMVLFSAKTRTPLAALTLLAPQSTCLLTARAPPPAPQGALEAKEAAPAYFQGMVKQDKASFTFAVTNLLSKGHLNFNLFPNDSELPINQVNAVNACETYSIPCDQRTNRAMCLETRDDPQNSGSKLTVGAVEESHARGVAKKGLQFKVVMTPETKGPGQALFEEGATFWEVVSGFVLPQERQVYLSKGYGSRGGRLTADGDMVFLETAVYRGSAGRAPYPGELEGLSGSLGQEMYSRGEPELAQSSARFCRDTSTSSRGSRDSTSDGSHREMSSGNSRGILSRLGFGGGKKSKSKGAPEPKIKEMGRRQLQQQSAILIGSDERKAVPPMLGERAEEEDTPVSLFQDDGDAAPMDISKTLAVDLSHTGDKVQVQSHTVEIDFAENVHSAPLLVIMSLWPAMKLRQQAPEAFEAWLKELAETKVAQAGQEMVARLPKVFKSDSCCICLEEGPNAIAITCGHQFGHVDCVAKLDKCAICRGFIAAMIKDVDMVV